MGWIKFDKDLIDDPRILRAANMLLERYTLSIESTRGHGFAVGSDLSEQESIGFYRNAVTGALVTLWVYADTHIRDGDKLPVSSLTINKIVGIDGFSDLLGPEWIEEIDGGEAVRLPGYCEKNGLLSRESRRESNAERQRRHRLRHNGVSNGVSNAHVTPLDQDLDQDLDQHQDQALDKNKIKDKTIGRTIVLPEWLPKDAWQAWLKTRKAKSNHRTALLLAIGKLEKWRAAGMDPRAVLEQSVVNGWQGLFELRVERDGAKVSRAEKKCAYCSKAATGAVGGISCCSTHALDAMDGKPIPAGAH